MRIQNQRHESTLPPREFSIFAIDVSNQPINQWFTLAGTRSFISKDTVIRALLISNQLTKETIFCLLHTSNTQQTGTNFVLRTVHSNVLSMINSTSTEHDFICIQRSSQSAKRHDFYRTISIVGTVYSNVRTVLLCRPICFRQLHPIWDASSANPISTRYTEEIGSHKMSISVMSPMKQSHTTMIFAFFVICLFLNTSPVVEAGPIAAGSAVSVCYTACNAGYVTCMTSSGLVAGTTGPVGWWAWATGAAASCSAVQAACMTTCTAVGLATAAAPTPWKNFIMPSCQPGHIIIGATFIADRESCMSNC